MGAVRRARIDRSQPDLAVCRVPAKPPAPVHPVLRLQQSCGNRAVATLLSSIRAREANLRSSHVLLARAGVTQGRAAPGGLAFIRGQAHQGSGTMGLTPIQSANAFTNPRLAVGSHRIERGPREGVRPGPPIHRIKVAPTTSEDVTHQSWYPEAGIHRVLLGKYPHYYRVSADMATLIAAGESEHLADAALAFDLTFGLIRDRINELAASGQEFSGPTEEAALADALRSLKLPAALGTTEAEWHRALDVLLTRASRRRDDNNWHMMTATGDDRYKDGTISDVEASSTTAIGSHPSSEVINYEAIGGTTP
jgi:hypothetical protein